MSHSIFVEQLTPDGEVLHRSKVTHIPITIGRAYDNDIILDDPHTAAHHAQIELNQLDELIIADLGSHNGITLTNSRTNTRENFFVVDGDKVYRLGHTHLRVRTADYQVAAEVTDLTNHQWEGLLPALTGLVLLLVSGLMSTWLADLNQGTLSKYLLELVSVFGFAIGWSGVWALFGKLFTGHARFGRHLFIASAGLAFLELWEHVSGLLAYALSWEFLTRFNSHPLIVICATVLYFHMRTAGNKRPGRLKLILIALVLLGSTITMTKKYQASNHLSDELYMSHIYPPAVRLSRDHSLEEFMADMQSLKKQVDDERKEKPEKEKPEQDAATNDQTEEQKSEQGSSATTQ
ncbi:FHA domain-containing protein [Cellvibrio sp. OA-2007]|uniref:FHA domain-containing protein n=1 Tax=Cellvibrio sp. OA-2007 TaxID=529823 RepID=UPI00078511E6|nr:FHA domain-containing protein [Cellvibrio sp. OA-2007]